MYLDVESVACSCRARGHVVVWVTVVGRGWERFRCRPCSVFVGCAMKLVAAWHMQCQGISAAAGAEPHVTCRGSSRLKTSGLLNLLESHILYLTVWSTGVLVRYVPAVRINYAVFVTMVIRTLIQQVTGTWHFTKLPYMFTLIHVTSR